MIKMQNLGKLIWRQSRDISVLNYPNHTVYEIFTNQGYIRISQDKNTQKILEVHDTEASFKKQKVEKPYE